MENAILLLFVGFVVGFYRRGRNANAEAANAKRHADTLDRQIDLLRSQIVTIQDAEVRRISWHGHDLSDDASDRMEVKRLAPARAGIPEVPAKASKADIVRMVDERLSAATALPN